MRKTVLIDTDKKIFNTEEIHRGTIVYARKTAWDIGITGIVMETSETVLRIQFLPSIQNVINHCFVSAEEVSDGLWFLRYSNDGLATVREYDPEIQTSAQEEHEENGGI